VFPTYGRRLRWLAATALITSALAAQSPSSPKPPETRRANVVDTVFGVPLPDPYRWLEDQQAPETRGWIDAENAYTQAVIGPLPGRERIQRRLLELLKVETIGMPTNRGGRYFFSRRAADQDLSVLYLRKGLHAADEVLVDPHPMSPDHTTSVQFVDVTPDGKLLAYGVRQGGEDEVTVRLMDVDTRRLLADTLPRARYSGVNITPDKSGIYYAKQTAAGPRVYYHPMGGDPATDKEIFGQGYGPGVGIGVFVTDDGKYMVISVSFGSAARKVELYFQNLLAKTPLTPIVNDVEAQFGGPVAGDHMYLRTNWNAANGKILDVDLKNPARANWRELIAEGAFPLSGISAVGGRLLVSYLQNVQTHVKIFDPGGKPLGEIAFPAIGALGGLGGDWDRPETFYSFSTLAQPTTIYRYDVATGKQEVWAKLAVPVSDQAVEIKQVWYPSQDGTKIPMFIAHRRGIKLDGANPTLLTGYGGFQLSQVPGFSQRAAFWLENGGVYALPNLRGGGEFGETWHQAGMLGKKQNVFDDFIAAAEWLIANKYTSPSRLAISGGSNGGLLVGAAMTQRPDLFQAVVCSFPLLDMVRYHRFLVARFWVPEYGSAEDSTQFKWILAYSPYQHVKTGERYPAVLFITGDADTRVAPLHARKMAALMQAASASGKPVLLRYNTKAGHSGGLPVSQIVDDLTDEMRFLFWQLSVPGGGAAAGGNE